MPAKKERLCLGLPHRHNLPVYIKPQIYLRLYIFISKTGLGVVDKLTDSLLLALAADE